MDIYTCDTCQKTFKSIYALNGHKVVHSEKLKIKKEKRLQEEKLKNSSSKKIPISTFLDNKYTKWYKNIIEKARYQPTPDYYETHHIIPRCMGGSDSSDNLIRLTAKQHFICHLLLTKMVPTNSMEYHKLLNAAMAMKCSSSVQSRITNSRIFETVRKEYSKSQSIKISGIQNSMYGRVWVSNLETKDCKAISVNDLGEYLVNGYIKKRVINFEKYFYKIRTKEIKIIEKEKIRLEKIKSDYEKFKILYEKYIVSGLTLRAFAEIHYDRSAIWLNKQFIKFKFKSKKLAPRGRLKLP